jgi:hypothetical protein
MKEFLSCIRYMKINPEEFMKYIRSISIYDLENAVIDLSDVGYVRTLGDMFFVSIITNLFLEFFEFFNTRYQVRLPKHLWKELFNVRKTKVKTKHS